MESLLKGLTKKRQLVSVNFEADRVSWEVKRGSVRHHRSPYLKMARSNETPVIFAVDRKHPIPNPQRKELNRCLP
ncbi:MAG: hypothetical protein MI923_10340 [Phycisphaerales bacterium]|nr:hypothetical protein [Phycisphaerales bacterium]